MTVRRIPLSRLPKPGKRPHVADLAVGQTVHSRYGRRMRVVATDEWVIYGWWPGERTAVGPYARLEAADDPKGQVIWPREWIVATGDTMALLED